MFAFSVGWMDGKEENWIGTGASYVFLSNFHSVALSDSIRYQMARVSPA